MIDRPPPGTYEHDLYTWLLASMSRAGRRVEFDACTRLAFLIQEHGHRDKAVRKLARTLGLNPKYLPRRRNRVK